MIPQILIAGFMIGVLGSFHCIGMCGPIALSLRVPAGSGSRALAILLYNLGRITTYALFGLVFGMIGRQVFIGGYQRTLSIAMGVFVLSFLFLFRYINRGVIYENKFTKYVKTGLQRLFRSEQKFYTFFLVGLLNGFLPCGLVYVAIGSAIATGSMLHSTLMMIAFGAGTLPVMYAIPAMGKYISVESRNQVHKAVPVFIAIMGILLILRGMNLGIPYVSPQLNTSGVHSCCHKQ
jgi:sulfite exporter TauE/SafE